MEAFLAGAGPARERQAGFSAPAHSAQWLGAGNDLEASQPAGHGGGTWRGWQPWWWRALPRWRPGRARCWFGDVAGGTSGEPMSADRRT